MGVYFDESEQQVIENSENINNALDDYGFEDDDIKFKQPQQKKSIHSFNVFPKLNEFQKLDMFSPEKQELAYELQDFANNSKNTNWSKIVLESVNAYW